jgi:putative restriction endonuclease
MDLIAEGSMSTNFIEPSFEVLDTFNVYWSRIMPTGTKGNMAYPFCRLQSDGFWHLVPNEGYRPPIECDLISSMTRLREMVAGARLDDELYRLLLQPEAREVLRAVILETSFDPQIHPTLLEQGRVNIEAHQYSRRLIEEPEIGARYTEAEEAAGERSSQVRDQGFRKAIVGLYNHRCALCGIRMLTPDGHTIVEAAHIVPWSESHDDRPTNGLALCRLCHWFFDEGFMSVGKAYEVLVSLRVSTEQNLPGHILTLTERQIFRPDEQVFWPRQENLRWHRKYSYLG